MPVRMSMHMPIFGWNVWEKKTDTGLVTCLYTHVCAHVNRRVYAYVYAHVYTHVWGRWEKKKDTRAWSSDEDDAG